MRGLLVAAAGFALAACDAATPPPPPAEEPAAPAPVAAMVEPAEPPPVDCTQISAVFAAFNEPVPFASLRVGPPISLVNAACQVGETSGPGASVIHAVSCTLLTSDVLDREKSAVTAKAAFVEARRQIDACLPADWTSRDGSVAVTDANEAMIYESLADAQRAMTGSSYTYPIQLKKAWVEGAAGEGSGWRVTLDFQKEAGRQ
jgi:hypothetical protein